MFNKIRRPVFIVFFSFITLSSVAFLFLSLGLRKTAALEIADADFKTVKDGEYTGLSSLGRWSNSITLKIDEGNITAIELTDPPLIHRDEIHNELFQKIIMKQSLAVDSVSGASVTSKAILKSVEDALRNAAE